VIGGGLVFALFLVAALAPVLSPFDPRALTGDAFQPPSMHHLLGTNNLGQDIASQVIWGTRRSATLALGAATISVTLGLLVGAASAILGGVFDTAVMRVVDVVLAVPRVPLLIFVGALAGAGATTLIALIALLTWPVVTRLVRSETLTLRQRGYVASARGFGASLPYVVRRHLAPALGPLLISSFVLIAGNAVLLEATLAFLGLSDPTAVSWGLILNRAVNQPGLYFTSAWTWWLLPPGFAITLAVLGFALLGVGLEPILNPRWQQATSP